MSRVCGECSVCCVQWKIPVLNKPARMPCLHLDGDCTIYEDRPQVCATFRCGWLRGMGSEDDRPDKSGKVILVKGHGVPYTHEEAVQ